MVYESSLPLKCRLLHLMTATVQMKLLEMAKKKVFLVESVDEMANAILLLTKGVNAEMRKAAFDRTKDYSLSIFLRSGKMYCVSL